MVTNVDLIGADGNVQGELANHMASNGRLDPNRMRPFIDEADGKPYFSVYKGGDPEVETNWAVIPALNTNATLRRDEWKQLDEAVVKAADYRLGGIDDLVSNGLTYNLGNAMGTTVLEWHDVSGDLEADLTMDGVTRANNNRPVWSHNYMPIPIIHVDYEINMRELATSRNMGNPLDTTLAERAARACMEKLENMLFTNTTYSFGEKDSNNRNTIYSYVNHPAKNNIVLVNAWDDSATTGKDIVDEVITWKAASIADRHYGPWMIYIPKEYETKLDEDYVGSTPDTNANATIRSRILAISGIKGIKVIDTLAANNVIFVQMTSDVVRLVRGLGLQNVEWDTEGKFITKYKVLTIQVPQIRADAAGRSGVCHIS
jgi:hypothetical protein